MRNAGASLIAIDVGMFALVASLAHAYHGSVILYQGANFQNQIATLSVTSSNTCYNIGSGDNAASSATWSGLPTESSGTSNFEPKIRFFTDADCTGVMRTWPTGTADFPCNFRLDSIDNAVTSLIVVTEELESAAWPKTAYDATAV